MHTLLPLVQIITDSMSTIIVIYSFIYQDSKFHFQNPKQPKVNKMINYLLSLQFARDMLE